MQDVKMRLDKKVAQSNRERCHKNDTFLMLLPKFVLPRCLGSERAKASVIPSSLVKLEIALVYIRDLFLARTFQFSNI